MLKERDLGINGWWLLQLKGARWASEGGGKALEGDGRALDAAGRVSKMLRQAFEADGRASLVARECSGE